MKKRNKRTMMRVRKLTILPISPFPNNLRQLGQRDAGAAKLFRTEVLLALRVKYSWIAQTSVTKFSIDSASCTVVWISVRLFGTFSLWSAKKVQNSLHSLVWEFMRRRNLLEEDYWFLPPRANWCNMRTASFKSQLAVQYSLPFIITGSSLPRFCHPPDQKVLPPTNLRYAKHCLFYLG